MLPPLELGSPVLGISETRYGNVLLVRGYGLLSPSGDLDSSKGTPAAVTVSKTECSRQPTCSVEC